MSRKCIDLRKVATVNQRNKNIVYGYMKEQQARFRWKDETYYNVPQLVQDIILLFFHMAIDTKIVTDDEIDLFMQFLKENDKVTLLQSEWKLLYRKSRDGNFGDEDFIKPIYENKQHIICLFHTEEDYIVGGYSKSGWKSDKKYNHDNKAFIFKIRSDKGYDPVIMNVREKRADKAINTYEDGDVYFIFGNDWALNIENYDDGVVYFNEPYDYSSDTGVLIDTKCCQVAKEVEIFQLQ